MATLDGGDYVGAEVVDQTALLSELGAEAGQLVRDAVLAPDEEAQLLLALEALNTQLNETVEGGGSSTVDIDRQSFTASGDGEATIPAPTSDGTGIDQLVIGGSGSGT